MTDSPPHEDATTPEIEILPLKLNGLAYTEAGPGQRKEEGIEPPVIGAVGGTDRLKKRCQLIHVEGFYVFGLDGYPEPKHAAELAARVRGDQPILYRRPKHGVKD